MKYAHRRGHTLQDAPGERGQGGDEVGEGGPGWAMGKCLRGAVSAAGDGHDGRIHAKVSGATEPRT